MKWNLKSFLKRATHNKDSVSESTSPQPEPRPGPTLLPEQRRTQEPESGTDQYRDRNSLAQSSQSSSHHGGSKHTSRRPSVQHPISANGDQNVDTTDYAPPPKDGPQEMLSSIVEDYRAYLPAASTSISPGSHSNVPGSDAEFISLGGDSRLRIGASDMRHKEDIADRNVEYYESKYSRRSSLSSQQQSSLTAQVQRKSVAASIESQGSPDSIGDGSIDPKYTLGTGVPPEGSLIDGILPHIKDPHALPYNRKDWPTRTPRDESHLNALRRKRRGSDDGNPTNIRRGSSERRNQKNDGVMNLREAVMGGRENYNNGLRANLDGVVDLRDTEDADKQTRWAPEVVHETVKPHEHEIIEERIYREIHNHEVYHYVQPVFETEILPARHWIYNPKGELVEMPEDKLPECTGANQRWSIVRGDREISNAHVVRSLPQAREPRIIFDRTYITPQGFERRETTILHPPELEDMSNFGGPVVPIEFLHDPEHAPERTLKETEKGLDHLPNGRRFKMEELSEALPMAPTLTNGSSSSSSQPHTGSSTSTPPRLKQLSIPRKPVRAVER